MNTNARTRLAVLGTLGDLHRQPIAYDLACLQDLVARLAPDLICAEVTQTAWENGELSTAAFEVREALSPVVAVTDIVLIPVAVGTLQFDSLGLVPGWRTRAIRSLQRLLRWGQRTAGRAEAVNGLRFAAFCHTVCWTIAGLWTADERAAWEAQTQALVANVLATLRRDPGRRVLVVVQCQRLHRLLPLLKAHKGEFDLVPYQAL
jgi:hypothetical protein